MRKCFCQKDPTANETLRSHFCAIGNTDRDILRTQLDIARRQDMTKIGPGSPTRRYDFNIKETAFLN